MQASRSKRTATDDQRTLEYLGIGSGAPQVLDVSEAVRVDTVADDTCSGKGSQVSGERCLQVGRDGRVLGTGHVGSFQLTARIDDQFLAFAVQNTYSGLLELVDDSGQVFTAHALQGDRSPRRCGGQHIGACFDPIGQRPEAGAAEAPSATYRYRPGVRTADVDRKSTRLNSSHVAISYAVFCL